MNIKEYKHNYYIKHKDKVIRKSKAWYKRHKRKRKAYMLEYKRRMRSKFKEKLQYKKCLLCNGTNNIQYHHIDKDTKVMNVGNMYGYSDKRLIHEMNKCILLCPKCHKRLHMLLNYMPSYIKNKGG